MNASRIALTLCLTLGLSGFAAAVPHEAEPVRAEAAHSTSPVAAPVNGPIRLADRIDARS